MIHERIFYLNKEIVFQKINTTIKLKDTEIYFYSGHPHVLAQIFKGMGVRPRRGQATSNYLQLQQSDFIKLDPYFGERINYFFVPIASFEEFYYRRVSIREHNSSENFAMNFIRDAIASKQKYFAYQAGDFVHIIQNPVAVEFLIKICSSLLIATVFYELDEQVPNLDCKRILSYNPSFISKSKRKAKGENLIQISSYASLLTQNDQSAEFFFPGRQILRRYVHREKGSEMKKIDHFLADGLVAVESSKLVEHSDINMAFFSSSHFLDIFPSFISPDISTHQIITSLESSYLEFMKEINDFHVLDADDTLKIKHWEKTHRELTMISIIKTKLASNFYAEEVFDPSLYFYDIDFYPYFHNNSIFIPTSRMINNKQYMEKNLLSSFSDALNSMSILIE